MNEAEFHRIFDAAALGSVQRRGQVAVAGPDRATFLQGFLTNDVEALAPGSGCYAAWLTPQGRMLTDLHVLASAEMLLLDLPLATTQATLDRLEQFHFSEDVTTASLAESLVGVWVHGPAAASALEHVVRGADGLASWADYRHQQASFRETPIVVARIDQLGVPGYCVYVDLSRQADLVEALVATGVHPVAQATLDAARVEAGYPLFGVDMFDDTIPLEAGIESRAISTTKGCYVGQEVIIRVLHRGHGRVAKKLVRLDVDGVVAAGALLRSGDREVGRVTSVASLRGRSVALAYVLRDFAQGDTHLSLESGTLALVATGPVLRPSDLRA